MLQENSWLPEKNASCIYHYLYLDVNIPVPWNHMVLLLHLQRSDLPRPRCRGVVVSACTGLAGTCDAVDHDGGGGTGIRPFLGESGGTRSFIMFDLPLKLLRYPLEKCFGFDEISF